MDQTSKIMSDSHRPHNKDVKDKKGSKKKTCSVDGCKKKIFKDGRCTIHRDRISTTITVYVPEDPLELLKKELKYSAFDERRRYNSVKVEREIRSRREYLEGLGMRGCIVRELLEGINDFREFVTSDPTIDYDLEYEKIRERIFSFRAERTRISCPEDEGYFYEPKARFDRSRNRRSRFESRPEDEEPFDETKPSFFASHVPEPVREAFAVMELDITSNLVDVKTSYKKMALILHPDKNPSEEATELFKELANAYSTLSEYLTSC